jgi:hypothetical protein
MGTKPGLEKERVKEDIVCDGDGISHEAQEASDRFAIHIPPDPYADIKDMVSDAVSINHKEPQGLTESIIIPFIRRARQ